MIAVIALASFYVVMLTVGLCCLKEKKIHEPLLLASIDEEED